MAEATEEQTRRLETEDAMDLVVATGSHGPDGRDEGRGKRLVQLMHELSEMPERKAVDELRLLQTCVYVFRRNHADLLEFLDFCENDPSNQDLWHMTTIRKTEKTGHETVRLLHNFVASAMSLRDLTILMHGRLHSDGSFPEYSAEAARRFKNDPLVQFVQKLRHYVVHVKMPSILFKANLDMDSGHADIRLGLAKRELMEWDDWKSVAGRYVEEADDQILLRAVVQDYEARIRDFYEWYGDKEQSYQDEALARFREKEAEYFFLAIEDKLDRYFALPDSSHVVSDRGLFLGLFDESEFERLERLPAPSAARTELALSLLAEHYDVPADLEARIRTAYSQAPFFTGTQQGS